MLQEVRKLALEEYINFIDPTCNVLNGTFLVEYIADELDLFIVGSSDIPEYIFDVVIEVELELIDQGRL